MTNRLFRPFKSSVAQNRVSSPRPQSPERYLQLVPSVEHGGHRMRAVWSRLYPRPIRETFHEFLLNIIKWTFGQGWWKHQHALPKEQRHIVIKWLHDFGALSKISIEQGPHGPLLSSDQSGPVAALLQFGYDLFCLQARDKLPIFLVERMRRHASFQGARQELLAAAVMLRAGFDIEFLDETNQSEKHCELIATHRDTGTRVGVEAKSRIREGVLNEPGSESDYTEDVRGVANLIRKAKKQKPEGMPFVIFVDINAPPTPGVPMLEKPWIRDLRRALDALPTPTATEPDAFTMVIATNHSTHYGDPATPAPPGEYVFIVSRHSEQPLPSDGTLDAIVHSIENYRRVPKEV